MRIDAPIFTGSFSLNGNTLQNLSAVSTTGSNTFVGNQNVQGYISASALTGSIDFTNLTNSPTLVSGSSQVVNILSSLNTATASFTPRISNLESKSASVDISITNINTFTASNANTSLNLKTGSYATTGSNTFFGTQTFSGSVYIANDLIVQGSSSIQYISASSVSIGTNIVQLNTANPSVRFAGLSIIDSGSVGGSGSFLYDSREDEFIFVHRGNGTNVTSSHFIMGPETFDNLGNETYLTCNVLSKGTGKEHLVDSCIFDNGTTTCIKNNLVGTGTACFGSDLILAATTGNIYGGTTVGSTIISNIGGQTYARFYGASHATTPNIISFINASSTSAIINASGDTCFANNVCALNLVSRCNIRVGVNGGYAVISGPTTGAAISLGSNSSTFDRNLSLGIVGGDLSFSPILTINAQTSNVGIGDCTPDRRLYVTDTNVTQGTFLAYNKCSTFCGTVIEGITDRTSNSGFNLINLKSSTTSMFMVRGDGLACFAGTVSVGGTIKATTGLLAANYNVYTYNDQFEIQNESAWRLRFQSHHNGAGYDYRIVQNNNGSDICVMTFICGNITVNQAATFNGNVGIGLSPSYKLDVSSGASGIVLNLDGTNAYNAETGIQMASSRAKISAFLNGAGGTPGSSLRFYTMPDGGSVTERLRINSDGVACFASTICAANAQIGCINSYNGVITSNGVITKSVAGTMVGATATYFDFPTWDDAGQGQMLEIKAFFDHYYNWGYGAHYYVFLTSRDSNTQALTMFSCGTVNGGSWMAYKTSSTNLRVCKVAGTYGGGGAYWIQVTGKQP